MNDLRFLSVSDVLAIHHESIEIEGGSHGLRDIGLLESAVAMPQQGVGGAYLHEDIAAMAAAYLFHISNSHPFIDGNKRTGVLAALVFLEENGFSLSVSQKDLEQTVLRVAGGKMDKDELILWLRKQLDL